MKINLSPQRRDDGLSVTKQGDILTINGDQFDFSTLPDGEMIEAGIVPCDWIVGPVSRIGGVLTLTLILPHGPRPGEVVAFPAPIIDPANGPVALPRDPVQTQEDLDAVES